MEHLELFRRDLLTWFARFQRDLPWRRTRDPYAIWISEIMLQQTRVAAVIPFFERFLSCFPNVQTLAEAAEPDLLSCWAGLGYYYRARNLQKAAKAIVQAGGFPQSHGAILELPGIGDYTAAAVASIAFDLPHAVLDGNVLRVLSRLFADPANIASGKGKKHFRAFADDVLDRDHPAAFNQAMMELGATVCLPKAPQCLLCPVGSHCAARLRGKAAEFPVKVSEKKSVKQERILYWAERADSILVWQRPADSRLMPGFWELPEAAQISTAQPGRLLGTFRHGITIYDYGFQVVAVATPEDTGLCVWKRFDELDKLPLSTIFRKAMRLVLNRTTPARVKVAVSI